MLELIDQLQRREVIGIDSSREESIGNIPLVANTEPYRLDAPVPQGCPEQHLGLLPVWNRDCNLDSPLTLGLQMPRRLLLLEPAPELDLGHAFGTA
jgi:hypothetical protein